MKKLLQFSLILMVFACVSTKKPANDLDLYLSFLTGTFTNEAQISEEIAQGKQIHPKSKHITGLVNDRILNLPQDFKGQYVIEESYYETLDKGPQIKHHLFLFSLTDQGKVNLRVQTPSDIENKLLTNDNKTLKFDYLKLSDIKRFKSADYQKVKDGFYLKNKNDLGNGLAFTLEETIGKNKLEVMELLEKDGKSITSYTTPIQYLKLK